MTHLRKLLKIGCFSPVFRSSEDILAICFQMLDHHSLEFAPRNSILSANRCSFSFATNLCEVDSFSFEIPSKSSGRRGESLSVTGSRIPCRKFLREKCTYPSCIFWHSPVCFNYKSESGCTCGEKCRLPSKKPKKSGVKRPVDLLKESIQMSCVSQDSHPKNSILRKEGKLRSNHASSFLVLAELASSPLRRSFLLATRLSLILLPLLRVRCWVLVTVSRQFPDAG